MFPRAAVQWTRSPFDNEARVVRDRIYCRRCNRLPEIRGRTTSISPESARRTDQSIHLYADRAPRNHSQCKFGSDPLEDNSSKRRDASAKIRESLELQRPLK